MNGRSIVWASARRPGFKMMRTGPEEGALGPRGLEEIEESPFFELYEENRHRRKMCQYACVALLTILLTGCAVGIAFAIRGSWGS